jgi:O-antigen/teichoic acid export membrane protein
MSHEDARSSRVDSHGGVMESQTERERAIGRRYMWQMLVLMALYVVILVLSIRALQSHHFSPIFQDIIAVTPAIPLFGVVMAVIQFMLSIDELQRQIHLEALAIAAGVTAALAISYTFLEGAGFPHSQAWWAFACVDVTWALSLPFVRRRYVE